MEIKGTYRSIHKGGALLLTIPAQEEISQGAPLQ